MSGFTADRPGWYRYRSGEGLEYLGPAFVVWQRRDGYGQSEPHQRGAKNCTACCCGYPHECDSCGGLVHSESGDEIPVGDDWEKSHDLCCDSCGALGTLARLIEPA